ncbi:carbohydrate kinase family protein [Chitinimonas koreensis]|uniref:carbohydrate kinase family protein n=1 Tax=Chitinimonas koreensis TaxID=356302 RepID=UPI00040C6369|nr:carbohydrate kinase family protein [Chitinimonas koreensis]QNM95006.1 carbohydrate kinase family protein [Chitinimonas koreensis]
MQTLDLLVLGGVGIDTIVRVPALPLPLADSIHVPAVRDYVAHTGNGYALAAQALGLRTRFLDFLGDDEQGRLVLERYRRRGLDFDYIVEPSGTRRSVNLVDPAGRRLSLYDGRHPDALRMPRDFYLPSMRAARHVHLSIMAWARDCFADVQALGLSSSTDLHDWDGRNDYHRAFAQQADLVFVSIVAMGGRHFEVMREILEQGRARLVVATGGEQGSWWLARGDAMPGHQPALAPERPVVDSNGAGDSFAAAFLYGWLQGLPPAECARLGALAGAYACSCHGTHEDFVTREQLLRLRAALGDAPAAGPAAQG